MSKIKIGKKYIVRGDTEQKGWGVCNQMNQFIGSVVKVVRIMEEHPRFECKCFDGDTWYFNEEDLQEIIDYVEGEE